jgi:hypothetical protein
MWKRTPGYGIGNSPYFISAISHPQNVDILAFVCAHTRAHMRTHMTHDRF